MGFDNGSMSFRVFYLTHPLPADHVARFARHAAPGLDALRHEPAFGWVTGRHLLDRNITEDSAYRGGFLRLTLMKAERKIPGALLRAECMMEELAAMQAEGATFIKREARAKIRKEVTERLLPQMPPQLSGIPIACGRKGEALLAGALSDVQGDLLTQHIHTTLGVEIVPMTPDTAALKRKRRSLRDLKPSSFSPECPDEEVAPGIGLDFLTWLWFYSEIRGGQFESGSNALALAIQGPLMFVMEGGGAHEARLRRGEPLLSSEAKACLLAGKKLRRARVVLAQDQREWSAEFDGETFAFRGAKMPKGEVADGVSMFQDRMMAVQTLVQGVLSLYDLFLDERLSADRWAETLREIRVWVTSRTARR